MGVCHEARELMELMPGDALRGPVLRLRELLLQGQELCGDPRGDRGPGYARDGRARGEAE